MAKRTAATFDKQLKDAMKHYADPERLATESVLATAYFLGEAVDRDAPPHWGRLLQQELLRAGHSLWGKTPPRHREEVEAAWTEILSAPGTPRYSYLILELRYFQEFFRPRSLQQIWEEFLQQSRAEFYRDVDRALADLGVALLRTLRPAARLERPPTVERLVGRTALQRRLQETLLDGQSIALSGASGAGKSSVAAALAAGWPSPAVFWFTVRPELNDRLYHLLYALGAFCHRHGATSLWRALAANQGRLDDPALLLTLARRDLAELADQQPLLIFDEVDLWDGDNEETPQVHQFVAGLQDVAPFLLVGQRVEQTAHVRISVDALTVGDTAQLLETNGMALAAADVKRLHGETGGNPRLLWLCLDLMAQGESLETVLQDDRGHVRPFESFLHRLWLRLEEAEQRLLNALAVFPTYAPRDPWPAGHLEQLHARRLITFDDQGGVALLPGIRNALLRALSAEQREELHREAASIHATRAEYTLAAFHLQHGARPEVAVQLWFPHREEEILRGQAAMAASIFHNVSSARLNKSTRRLLEIIRAELHQLVGNLRAGLETLAQSDERDDPADALTVEVQRLRGDFLDALGAPDQALGAYADALATIAEMQAQTVDIHIRRGLVHVRQRRLPQAWQAARQAHYQAEQFQGLVLEEQGDLAAAEEHYTAALAMAQSLGDANHLAEINRRLCNLYGRWGQVEVARRHAEEAIAHYERVGNLVDAALVRSNLAAAFLDAGQFEDVLAVGTPAFEFFQEHGHSHRLAGTVCNLAEAHFELGNLDAAERLAELALREEEPLAVPYAAYTLALVHHARGNRAACLQWLGQCRTTAQANEDIFIEAYAWLKTAEIVAGDPNTHMPDAPEAAGRAMQLFQRLGLDAMAEQAEQLLG